MGVSPLPLAQGCEGGGDRQPQVARVVGGEGGSGEWGSVM